MKTLGRKCFNRMAGIVLALLVFLAMMPMASITANAYDPIMGKTIGDYTYDIYDDGSGGNHYGSVWVVGYNGTDTQLVLPTSVTYNGITYDIKSFEFVIGSNTFRGNTKIQKVAIPDGNDILRGSFANCTGLTEVAIGNNVQSVGKYDGGDGASAVGVFSGCSNLKTYRISGAGMTSQEDINHSGIGQDNEGKIYPDVTVYTKKGSQVDIYIQKINAASTNGNTIKLVYDDDPYSKNTVTPGGGGGNTPSGGNGSYEKTDAAIKSITNDKDVSGSTFGLLQARAKKVGKTDITLGWTKPKGTAKFVVYGNNCNAGKKKYKYVKLTETTKNTLKLKKINSSKVKKGTYYKFIVVALDKNGNVIATSKTVHAATTGGKVGNDKAVTTAAKKNKVTLAKKGKKFKLKAKATPASSKLKVKRHRKIAYESSDTSVATVSSKGVITAKKKGTCYVYAYAQNGVFRKIKVTVKK